TRKPGRSLICVRYMSSLPEMSSHRYPTSTSTGTDWPAMAPQPSTPPRVRRSFRSRPPRLIGSLLEKLRREIRPVHGGVTGRAVAIPRGPQVVERRRLRTESVGGARLRMAREAELIDSRPGEHLRIVRAVRLMAGQAVSGRAGHVIENEGATLL